MVQQVIEKCNLKNTVAKLSNGLQSELQINGEEILNYPVDGSKIRSVITYCWKSPDRGLVGLEFFD